MQWIEVEVEEKRGGGDEMRGRGGYDNLIVLYWI
jgi:hypothetical protein